jgi:ADP-ribosylglycohydrolase
MLARNEEEALQLADSVTLITHNHPEAIASAHAVALAVLWSRRREPVEMIVEELEARFSYNLQRTPDDIRPGYKHSERANESVPEAIVCGLRATSLEDALRNAVSIGGDSDTICAIAGAIAEARFGIPQEVRDKALSFLTDDMRAIVDQFYARWDNEAGLVWSC